MSCHSLGSITSEGKLSQKLTSEPLQLFTWIMNFVGMKPKQNFSLLFFLLSSTIKNMGIFLLAMETLYYFIYTSKTGDRS